MPQHDRLQYHILPTDDPVRALNILRDAAGLEQLDHDGTAQPDASGDSLPKET